MVERLVLASKNGGKLKEISAILSDMPIGIVGLDRYPDIPDIEEDAVSFFGNALKKARVTAEYTRETALADDSGLEVECLQGAPGIFSARYAGTDASDSDNIAKLLAVMRDVPPENRAAAFRCVIVLYEPDGRYRKFEGRWSGRISGEPRGGGGFGYDPVFFLPEQGLTVAELAPEEKNRLSHRAQAVKQLKHYLQQRLTK